MRALECLGKHFNLTTQNLLEGIDQQTTERIRTILKDASKEVHGFAAGRAAEDARRLIHVADNTPNAANVDRDFGLMVADLLAHFGLHDATAMDSYYRESPRLDGRNWPQLLSMLRDAVIHTGYFAVGDGTIDSDDITSVARHLHDILMRILLKSLDYDGFYQPSVTNGMRPERVDWVTETTKGRHLGYGVGE